MLRFFKRLITAFVAASAFYFTSAPAHSNPIPSAILDELLADGGWTPSADDNNEGERLRIELVQRLVREFASDPRTIGLLSLTLSAAKWGVEREGSLPADPAGDAWRGPTRASGKHLMSYKVGGIGLPHLDVGELAKFIEYLLAEHSTIGGSVERDYLRKLARDLRAGKKYDQVKTNAVFRKWMLEGLRRRDAQEWILTSWLDTFWVPAYRASNGDVRLALVLARIWNTSPRLGACAAKRAARSGDPIQAALQAYVDCPGGRRDYKARRWGWMKRPVVLFDAFASTKSQLNP
ncbi:hypothetical protein [Mesorhizobium sp. LNJC391B00]|uniref:hypothetical protein n=1 Tax=Mesorhizobium sp. LNJC391B00 TaxID=1287273 RepID=UPI0003CE525F|nr:hypothetical protein [Mesorhizobium sp. LNJC391B00]ESY17064.1 hypothetical protein X749_31400 [Mesorhizobium sp. LNJC391B00]